MPSGPGPVNQHSTLEQLSRIGAAITLETDPDKVVQRVTDEATKLVGAQFGAFFYNTVSAAGESYVLYTLSGVPREAFSRFPMPRNTAIFAPTFNGEATVRSDDITQDPRYGHNKPYKGMPEGHLPVRSYLASSVRSIDGEVLGGLFFGHADPGVFTAETELSLNALVPLAATALANARLFHTLKTREEELRTSEVKYRLISEAMQEGVWMWDILANRVEWNDRLLELLGVDRANWSGDFTDYFNRVHPDDQDRMSQALKDHLEQKLPYRVDLFRLRHQDGHYLWCTTAGKAEWDEQGQPVRMAGSFRDVTDHKAAHDRLLESEHRHRQILDSIEDMVFTKNQDLQVTWANAATCKHFGMSVEQLRVLAENEHDPKQAIVHKTDDRRVFETGLTVERTDETPAGPGGEPHVFHTVKTPVKNTQGQVTELVGVARDVTQRKRELDAQKLLAQSSAILGASIEYEATLDNVARSTVPTFADWAAVDLVDAGGRLRRISVHHSDPTKVLLAKELHDRYPPDLDAPSGVAAVIRTGKVEAVFDIPDELLVAAAKDEEHLRIARELGLKSYIAVPLVIRGKTIGVITFVTAESHRRYVESDVNFAAELGRRASVAVENAQLYQQVRELAKSLEERVAQRTAALAEANRELEAFSYSVSHDLRAPVRHISGFVDLVRGAAGPQMDDRARRHLDTIKSAAAQMGDLIDGLLAFSRLGRTELRKRPVDLQPLVQSLLREIEPDTQGRNIEWRILDLPTVLADATMVRLVVANYINNAIKYTRDRAKAVIEIGGRAEAGEHVVWVKDNGVGFKMDYVKKLFGVFQRLHGPEQFEGTGIGLATARRVINRQGGRTWAEGIEGQGATFYFALPVKETDHE